MLDTALGPTVSALLRDPAVIEVRCNADGKIFADWIDRPSAWTGQALAPELATQVICVVADAVDQTVGPAAKCYIIDAEFPGCGFRFHGDLPPVVPGPCFNIRKRPSRIISLSEYVAAGIMTDEQRGAIESAVQERLNILVVGGTKAGKTTLANSIIDVLKGEHERVATIEHVLELEIRTQEWHRYRVIAGVHDAAQLVEGCLRVSPDRIIVGEVRGDEIYSMLEAWETGPPGGICTIHSDTATPAQALRRVDALLRKSNQHPIPELIANTINLIVPIQALHYDTAQGARIRRFVPEVVRVHGFHGGRYEFERIA
jgi:type IV secretion system protein VirB11